MPSLVRPRMLALTFDGRDRPYVDSLVRWFGSYLLVHLACEDWLAFLQFRSSERLWSAGALSMIAIIARTDLLRRAALWTALALLSIKMAQVFPSGATHLALEYVSLLFVCVARDDASQRPLLLSALRWLAVVPLLVSGLQKLSYATYFSGSFLATQMHMRGFHWVFMPLVQTAELERLQAMAAAGSDGPYAFDSWAAIAASNFVWAAEIVLGTLLLCPRWRTIAALLSIAFMAVLQAAAYEFMFGLIMLNLVALHIRSEAVRWITAASYTGLATLLLVQLGLGPTKVFN